MSQELAKAGVTRTVGSIAAVQSVWTQMNIHAAPEAPVAPHLAAMQPCEEQADAREAPSLLIFPVAIALLPRL
jgi:hypothetical protein